MSELQKKKEQLEQEYLNFDFRKNDRAIANELNLVNKEIYEQNREPRKSEIAIGFVKFTSTLIGGAMLISIVLGIVSTLVVNGASSLYEADLKQSKAIASPTELKADATKQEQNAKEIEARVAQLELLKNQNALQSKLNNNK